MTKRAICLISLIEVEWNGQITRYSDKFDVR
jgi:hypothetical protein